MNRQPTVPIEGTLFYVDVLHDELRQKDNPKNRISFSVFDQHGDGYTFLYDKATQSAAELDENAPLMKETYKWVTLSARGLLRLLQKSEIINPLREGGTNEKEKFI